MRWIRFPANILAVVIITITFISGRNDFRVLQVTQDDEKLYFLARTAKNITPYTDPNWMWLFIDIRDQKFAGLGRISISW